MEPSWSMHWTHRGDPPSVGWAMRADDVQSTAPILHGAYICLPAGDDLAARAERLGLRNEFEPGAGAGTFALLRRVSAQPGEIADGELLDARAIMHVAAPDP